MNAKAHKVRERKLLTAHTARLISNGQLASQDPHPPKFPFMDEINHRAETMTPLLKGILEFSPRPRWH